MIKPCLQCNEEFNAEEKEIKRGGGRFCSRACFFAHRALKPRKAHNCSCALCGTTFYRGKSRQLNKNGLQFCSLECSNKARESERNLITRSDTAYGCTEYRYIAKRNKELVCEVCGYCKIPEVLQVHHKDRNRKNSAVENLEILCPTCHEEHHFTTATGRFTKQRG
jgi:5-methylcytosine-specific restriction endonuclease McrA